MKRVPRRYQPATPCRRCGHVGALHCYDRVYYSDDPRNRHTKDPHCHGMTACDDPLNHPRIPHSEGCRHCTCAGYKPRRWWNRRRK